LAETGFLGKMVTAIAGVVTTVATAVGEQRGESIGSFACLVTIKREVKSLAKTVTCCN